MTLQTMSRFVVFVCIAGLLGGTWSEEVDSNQVDDGILYVGRNMLERVQNHLDRDEDVTHEMMSKLLGFLPDEEIMTPVDVNGVDVDFVSIDVWLRDLGARGTAKALVKAAHHYKESKKSGTETQAPQFVGTLMLEQARDKLAMDEEVTDEDVAKMLGFLPDERSFVALDLSRHGHDLSDIDAWLSNQGLKSAAEACVAAARSDSSADVSTPSILLQEMAADAEHMAANTGDANTSDSLMALETHAEPAQDMEDKLPGVDEEEAVEEVVESEEEGAVEEQEAEESLAEAESVEDSTQEEAKAPVEEEEQQEEAEWATYQYYANAVDLAEEQVNATDKSDSDPPSVTDTAPQRVRWCTLNPGCERFQGLCCPDTRGRMLDCCATAPLPSTELAANLQSPFDDEDEGVYFPKFAGSWR